MQKMAAEAAAQPKEEEKKAKADSKIFTDAPVEEAPAEGGATPPEGGTAPVEGAAPVEGEKPADGANP